MEKAKLCRIYYYIFRNYNDDKFYLDRTDNFVKSEEYYLKESEERKKDYILIPKKSESEQVEVVKKFVRDRFSDETVEEILNRYDAWGETFPKFRNFLEENYLYDDYFYYEDEVAKEIARKWLEDNNIEYTDGSYNLDCVRNYIDNDASEEIREKFFKELEKDKEKNYLEAFKRLCLEDGTNILFDFYESYKKYRNRFDKYLYSPERAEYYRKDLAEVIEKDKEEYKNSNIEERKEYLYYAFIDKD